MQDDRQKLVRVLKAELAFLESGGYWSVGLPSWRDPLIFEDSPTCLRRNRTEQASPCSECALSQLVPREHVFKKVPCRHIPLNEPGETLDSLYRSTSQEKVESTVARWLRTKICELQESEPSTETSCSGRGSIQARAQPT
jgi:hypothetical protein